MAELENNTEKYEESELDWDFDFSKYEKEEEQDEIMIDLKSMKKPVFTTHRSKFSNGEKVMEKLAELEIEISKNSIKIGSRTQDINDLWRFYAIIDEYWDNIRHTYGKYINNDVNVIKKKCRELMEDSTEGAIDYKVHNNLLYLKSTVYRLAQFGNFRFEVERTGRGIYSKATRKILQ